eukprot:TRINITY_DN22228_c0_g1_i1.p1 TRINITY_DN22228_c0_g1~~TRINITY_DN22228_c0_g1_i1.p1  ORF type:complete len:552 (+),score=199.58 TRINITY_DN22228_c0_g1_i1:69-1658(+)
MGRDRRGGRSRSREEREKKRGERASKWEGRAADTEEKARERRRASRDRDEKRRDDRRDERRDRDDRRKEGGQQHRDRDRRDAAPQDPRRDDRPDHRRGHDKDRDRRGDRDRRDHRDRDDRRHRDDERDRDRREGKNDAKGHKAPRPDKDRRRQSSKASTISEDGSEAKRKVQQERKERTQYAGQAGDMLDDGRLRVLRKLGEGTFSRVMECVDAKLRSNVAVKIIRAEQKYMEGAEEELAVLKFLAHSDPANQKHIIRVNYTFMQRKEGVVDRHTCIVVPLFGPSVFQVLERNKFKGFTNSVVRSVMYQLVTCLEYVHSFGIVHTDIKPENVLFKNPKMMVMDNDVLYPVTPEIIVIDFGSAYNPNSEDSYKKQTVGTRHYRAPEAVLHMDWDTPADVWAIGTMMVELSMGECMFQTHHDLEHLAMMEHVIGPLPRMMTDRRHGRDGRDNHFFRADGAVAWPTRDVPEDDVQFVRSLPDLKVQCAKMTDKSGVNHFYELIQHMLHYDPKRRVTCKEALRNYKFLRVATL